MAAHKRCGIALRLARPGAWLPNNWPVFPTSCTGVPGPMVSVATCGRGAESPRSFAWRSACPTTLCMSAGCLRPSDGAPKSPPGVPVSAMRPPSRTGASRPGPPSKGGASPAAHDPLYRRIWLLSLAECDADLCACGADAHLARVVDARSPLGHQRLVASGQVVLPLARAC